MLLIRKENYILLQVFHKMCSSLELYETLTAGVGFVVIQILLNYKIFTQLLRSDDGTCGTETAVGSHISRLIIQLSVIFH